MDSSVGLSTQFFFIGDILFSRALDGLPEEDLFKAPVNVNPLIWLAGHLTYYRGAMANRLGGGHQLPHPELFARYSKLALPGAYPDIATVRSMWERYSGELKEGLPRLSEELLSGPGPDGLPIKDKTLRGAIAFMAWHEAYHIGQMSYVRKWLGHGGLVDG